MKAAVNLTVTPNFSLCVLVLAVAFAFGSAPDALARWGGAGSGGNGGGRSFGGGGGGFRGGSSDGFDRGNFGQSGSSTSQLLV
jgi:hypothetical protein